jgi:hypothetical protein
VGAWRPRRVIQRRRPVLHRATTTHPRVARFSCRRVGTGAPLPLRVGGTTQLPYLHEQSGGPASPQDGRRRWNRVDVAGDGIDPATDRPSSPSPLSVGAQDRPHTLVAKVPPPSRHVCGQRGGGAGAKGVWDPPVGARGHGSVGRTPRGGTTGGRHWPYELFRGRDMFIKVLIALHMLP